jgi:hypothetical protein
MGAGKGGNNVKHVTISRGDCNHCCNFSSSFLIVTTLNICIFPPSTTLGIHALSLFPFLILKIAHK